MYRRLLLILLILSNGKVHAMEKSRFKPIAHTDIQKGQLIKWHTREYSVTHKEVTNNSTTIIMKRDSHKVCGIPLINEYITRKFSSDNETIETIQKFKPSPTCIKVATTGMCLLPILTLLALTSCCISI